MFTFSLSIVLRVFLVESLLQITPEEVVGGGGRGNMGRRDEIASGQELLILLQSKVQGFESVPELKSVSQRPSW